MWAGHTVEAARSSGSSATFQLVAPHACAGVTRQKGNRNSSINSVRKAWVGSCDVPCHEPHPHKAKVFSGCRQALAGDPPCSLCACWRREQSKIPFCGLLLVVFAGSTRQAAGPAACRGRSGPPCCGRVWRPRVRCARPACYMCIHDLPSERLLRHQLRWLPWVRDSLACPGHLRHCPSEVHESAWQDRCQPCPCYLCGVGTSMLITSFERVCYVHAQCNVHSCLTRCMRFKGFIPAGPAVLKRQDSHVWQAWSGSQFNGSQEDEARHNHA